jgi:hypothetical protein
MDLWGDWIHNPEGDQLRLRLFRHSARSVKEKKLWKKHGYGGHFKKYGMKRSSILRRVYFEDARHNYEEAISLAESIGNGKDLKIYELYAPTQKFSDSSTRRPERYRQRPDLCQGLLSTRLCT